MTKFLFKHALFQQSLDQHLTVQLLRVVQQNFTNILSAYFFLNLRIVNLFTFCRTAVYF